MKRNNIVVVLIFACLMNSGCAVYMAANQPGKKDLGALTVGMPRQSVIADLGAPVFTEEKDGEKSDIFRFKQGYSGGTKAVRAAAHGVADVFTLGLWEVVGTPAEAVMSGKDMAIKVTYDKEEKLKEVIYMTGK